MNWRPWLVLVLLLIPGCASADDKHQWDDFWKDLRGDNMKMRSDLPQETNPDAGSWSLKPHD